MFPRIQTAIRSRALTGVNHSMATHGSSAAIVQRTFGNDEKFWVTKVDVMDDGVVFGLFSDPIDDVPYYGELKFPFPKGQAPLADDLLKTVAEVLAVVPAENASA